MPRFSLLRLLLTPIPFAIALVLSFGSGIEAMVAWLFPAAVLGYMVLCTRVDEIPVAINSLFWFAFGYTFALFYLPLTGARHSEVQTITIAAGVAFWAFGSVIWHTSVKYGRISISTKGSNSSNGGSTTETGQ